MIPAITLIHIPTSTSLKKCTPAKTLESIIITETESDNTPKSKLTYSIAIDIINALAVCLLGML